MGKDFSFQFGSGAKNATLDQVHSYCFDPFAGVASITDEKGTTRMIFIF